MDGAAGKEIAVAEGRGAEVKGQSLPDHPQVNTVVGKQSTFGIFNLGHLHSGDFAVLQFPLDGLIELLYRHTKAVRKGYPMLQHFVVF